MGRNRSQPVQRHVSNSGFGAEDSAAPLVASYRTCTRHAVSRIVTFYSYKGGVGRTLALANIGVLLAKRGKRVLLMDWDLEAPGLDRYFGSYLPQGFPPNRGTIFL